MKLTMPQRQFIEDLAYGRLTGASCTNATGCALEKRGLVDYASNGRRGVWFLTEAGRATFEAMRTPVGDRLAARNGYRVQEPTR